MIEQSLTRFVLTQDWQLTILKCPALFVMPHIMLLFWPINLLVYLLNTSVSIRKSHLSANIWYSVNVWVMEYIHHNSSEIDQWFDLHSTPFFHSCSPEPSHVLKRYAMLLTSCLSIKASYKDQMQENEKHIKELYETSTQNKTPADSTGSHIRNNASCWCYEWGF